MTKDQVRSTDEALSLEQTLRLALETFESMSHKDSVFAGEFEEEITAIKATLEANDEIDWKDMYEKEKRRSEMWVAKYEKDIGPLEKAVPHQEAKDEPVATKNNDGVTLHLGWDDLPVGTKLYATPPQRKPLTDEEIDGMVEITDLSGAYYYDDLLALARAIEAAHGIKENT